MNMTWKMDGSGDPPHRRRDHVRALWHGIIESEVDKSVSTR